MRSDSTIPEVIRAAGDSAVRAYRAFLDNGRLSANTRRVYGNHVRRFCRWAETCELPLSLIAPFDVAAYLRPFSSHHAALQALPVLRQFFIPFIAAGLLTSNPCGRRGWPRAKARNVAGTFRLGTAEAAPGADG
jgi:site-specific recombinase XerD